MDARFMGPRERDESVGAALQRIQKLVHAVHKFEPVASSTRHPSCQPAKSTNLRGTGRGALTLPRGAAHPNEHQRDGMDPRLWSKLPTDMLEFCFARLPVSTILSLCALSMEWSTMSKSLSFRRVFFQTYPNMFKLVSKNACDVVYDVRTCTLPVVPPNSFGFRRLCASTASVLPPKVFDERCLTCFVSQRNLSTVPILVGDPRADEWTQLPCIPNLSERANEDPIVVQLVQEYWNRYRLIVVSYQPVVKEYSAYCYESMTRAWSCVEASQSYGNVDSRLDIVDGQEHRDFDLITGMLLNLVRCSSLQGAHARRSAMVKERVFVLHYRYPIDQSLFGQAANLSTR